MLAKVQLIPGFDKQVTETGAEGRWTGGDYVRFRYGLPEKIGGWEQLGTKSLLLFRLLDVLKKRTKSMSLKKENQCVFIIPVIILL